MVSCKWLLKLTRSCANWNVAQRQIQLKQTIVPHQTFVKYQNSLTSVIEKGLTNISNPEICTRLKKLTEYNIVSGKQIRGLLMISACDALLKPELKEELQPQVFALAWAIEMFHSYFLITDDMEDGATTRRGKTCWHLLPEVGSYAINDAGMLRTFISEILMQYFGGQPVYPKIVDIFNKAYFKTHIGQFMDTMSCKNRDYLNFTMEKYITIVIHKTSFYSYEFPILLALALSNKGNEEAYKLVKSICRDLGLLYQMQNDYLDYYEDESVGGKSGTDIQEGKCTWLVLTALEHCNLSQRQEFLHNYGKWEKESVDRIRRLYKELELSKKYAQEKQKLYDTLCQRINNLPEDVIPPSYFLAKLVNMVYTVKNIHYYEKI
ncbi:unnamed protein product [Parnassius apollo]|uniref:Farnesyl pyrophosphate synthase n=1 Tax=Parnassius apollo TaxID=110799 RepID=A0A8S3Y0W7_PARAO|nr:unnamed protein product [Parnassius apollo]